MCFHVYEHLETKLWWGKKNQKSGFFCRGLVVTGEGHANTEMFYEIREGDSKRLRDSES